MKIRGTTVFLIVVVVILLALAVVANINQFKQLGLLGGSKAKKPIEEVKRPDTNNPPVEERTPPIESNRLEKENSPESGNSNWRASLSPSLYGRSNPFLPLRGARPGPGPEPKPKPEEKEAPGPLMQLTAILGDQAIVKVGGASKTISAGDTLAGMEVLSIGGNEVLLRKEDKDYTITLGEEPKHVPPGEAE